MNEKLSRPEGQAPAAPPSIPAEENVARFGHHPDPAIDFCTEVDAIEAEITDRKAGLSPTMALAKRIERAMQFRPGGDTAAITAKHDLRRIEAAFKAALEPVAAPPSGVQAMSNSEFDYITVTSSLDALQGIVADSAEALHNITVLRSMASDAAETIAQLTRALREATEPPTFMGEPVVLKRYAMGFFKGAPAMFEQPDGDYVKWKDVRAAPPVAPAPAREGWQWVPKEPTEAMKAAGGAYANYDDPNTPLEGDPDSFVARKVYKAMLSAAAPADQPSRIAIEERAAAKKARPPSDEEPWVVADDTGVRVTFHSEDSAWRWRNEHTDRLENPTVTYEPAAVPAEPPAVEADAKGGA